jgi:hypothetical protein
MAHSINRSLIENLIAVLIRVVAVDYFVVEHYAVEVYTFEPSLPFWHFVTGSSTSVPID